MNWKKDWDNKLWNEFQECTWEELQLLLKDAYDYAKFDSSYKNEYTHLILFNLQMLAEYGIDKISFKQWKSFRAYVSSFRKESISIDDLFKNLEK